ncbi:hypothetical protein L1077_16690 [Pseudoalteromonas luteoviolacea]|uniref:hypothetical protein n=1 Tax=Pseudoalteromonas luteoviolacea TaxID=43657 RepID=UPI001F361796|nr:hypothetical protein [Pseudoalteromonas luteoviolacea]MCF6441075.1 hypothetical protein [Pseudoalteromonas luteoviolacea]
MQKIFVYYVSVIMTLLLSLSASAWQEGGTYFRSGGSEIKVDHTSFGNRVTSLKFDITCYSNQCNRNPEIYPIMYDFVSAVIHDRLYTYSAYTTSPEGCTEQACSQPEVGDLDDRYSPQNAGIAEEADSSAVSAITDTLMDKSKNSNSLDTYMITAKVIGGQRKPISMCKVDEYGICNIEEDVIFVHKAGDHVDASFKLRNSSAPDLVRHLHILQSFESFNYSCATTYPDSEKRQVANMVCHPEKSNI